MTLHFARSILKHDDDEARWELLCERQSELLWDEYGDEVEQFNRIARAFGLAEEAVIEGMDADITMRYRGRTVAVPVFYDREDNLRAVHTLSQLARDVLEFRLCRDTVGNSENAFMMLPPAQWHELEQEYGRAAVARRFMPVAPSWDAFTREAFDEEALPG